MFLKVDTVHMSALHKENMSPNRKEFCRELFRVGVEHGFFLERVNRFSARISRNNMKLLLHVTNTGRLEDLLRNGVEVLYIPKEMNKTAGRLVGVRVGDKFALIDTRLQAEAFEKAFQNHLMPWLEGYKMVGREAIVKGGRIDYVFLDKNGLKTFVELKSAVYLNIDGGAMYPDTVSLRGRKHISLLTKLSKRYKCKIVFVAAHPAAKYFTPCDQADPLIRQLLIKAVRAWVDIRAVKIFIDCHGNILWCDSDLPVKLAPS